MYREPHDQTVNRHLVVSWGWTVSLISELNLREVFLVLLVPYFDLYLSAMLEFCRYVRVWRSKRNKKKCFKTLDKGRRWKHFILRVQGLSLASDGAHDKNDAWFVSYFIHVLSWSVIKLLFACNGFSVGPQEPKLLCKIMQQTSN